MDYRKAGYSKKFYESHREDITLHKAAKKAFDELGIKKLPKMKDLSDEYASVLTKKRTAYSEYRKARLDMQEYLKAKKNVEQFFNLVNQENMPEREQQKFREKLNILRWRSHPIT